ncbi:MAG: SPOR domain-containing protein, partial [Gammaproteobacteria bacterium]
QWGEEAKIYRTTLKGKPWYVLAYGEYENIAAAKKALAALPGKSQKWTPFIRKLSTIAPAMPTEKSAISVKKEMSTEPVVIASSEKQLLAAKPTAYTIQLLANAQLPVIEDFIKMNSLGKKAMWYRTTREGADFYVLTYGIYNDLTAAKQGMKELPNSLESVTPFVRQLSSIQTAIKQK